MNGGIYTAVLYNLTMQYRKQNDQLISSIGIGCYAISGVYGRKNPKKIKQVIRRAFDLGVNFFDTAEAYGDGERVLGDAVKPFRDEVFISTKVGIKQGTKANLSAKNIQESCENSLTQLNTEVIDLYQVHFDDPDTPVEETIAALEALKTNGKIRYYGVGHLPQSRMQQYLEHGKLFSMMMELSAVADDNRTNLLPLCENYQVGAIAFSVTGRGILTGAINRQTVFEEGDIRRIDPLFQRERFASALRVAKKLTSIGERYGRSAAQISIAWVLAQPRILCALCGPSTIPHLEENLASADWVFPEDERINFERWLGEEKNTLLHAQSCTVENILAHPLHPDSAQAFTDLVYVVETSINAGWVDEKQVLPIFQHLFAFRPNLDQEINDQFLPIQKKLSEMILPGMRSQEGLVFPGI